MQNSLKKRLRYVAIGMALGILGCASLLSQLGQGMLYVLADLVVVIIFVGYILSIKQNEKYREALSEKSEKEKTKKEKKTLLSHVKEKIW
jgi:uncharacterized membrane protein YfcA